MKIPEYLISHIYIPIQIFCVVAYVFDLTVVKPWIRKKHFGASYRDQKKMVKLILIKPSIILLWWAIGAIGSIIGYIFTGMKEEGFFAIFFILCFVVTFRYVFFTAYRIAKHFIPVNYFATGMTVWRCTPLRVYLRSSYNATSDIIMTRCHDCGRWFIMAEKEFDAHAAANKEALQEHDAPTHQSRVACYLCTDVIFKDRYRKLMELINEK